MTAKGERQHAWTTEDDDFVRGKLAEGYSYGQIAEQFKAREINVSRNAIIGRALRKNLGTSAVRQGYQPRRKTKIPAAVPAAKASEIIPLPAKVPAPKKRKQEEKPATVLPFQPPGEFKTQVLNPDPAQCQWIDGDIRLGTAAFCTAAHVAGSYYCLAHHTRVWVPVSDRERRRPKSTGFFHLPPKKANKK